VEALLLALLDGQPARSKVGARGEARGLVARRPPDRTRAARQEDRLGPLRAALGAATLHRVFGASARNALAG
jgi:hypothetical protein